MSEEFATLDGALLNGAEDCSNAPAVYFLYKGNDLVYVGKSVNALRRVTGHNISGWDTAVALPTPVEKLDEVEYAMIDLLQPPWNRHGVKKMNRQPRRCANIVVKLTETQRAVIGLAAHKKGVPVSTFILWSALEKAAKMGFHPEQPKAD
jgi:hypothetical protein